MSTEDRIQTLNIIKTFQELEIFSSMNLVYTYMGHMSKFLRASPLVPFYNIQGAEPFNSLRLSVTEAYLLHIKWANISYVV